MAVNGQGKLPNLKAVIVDYGDVLCLPPACEEIEASARILGIDSDLYRVLWSRNRDVYDRGDISPESYWRLFAEEAAYLWMRPSSMSLTRETWQCTAGQIPACSLGYEICWRRG
jgi:hypothetical protein